MVDRIRWDYNYFLFTDNYLLLLIIVCNLYEMVDRIRWDYNFFYYYFFLQLVDISADNFLSLMQESGDIREDIKIPDSDLGAEIRAKFDGGEDILCTVLCAMGTEMVIATKPNSTK